MRLASGISLVTLTLVICPSRRASSTPSFCVLVCIANRTNISQRVGGVLHLPDIIFILNINDEPRSNSWSFARSDDQFTPNNPWLMPHFSSWSWPLEYLGPLDQAHTKIARIEQSIPFENNIEKAVWRGTAWFNPPWSIGLRPKLVEVADGKDWADVEIWSKEKANTILIEDVCRYKYIIYAEV
jgi:hypothetical protein